MYAFRRTVLVVIAGGMVAAVGQLAAEDEAVPTAAGSMPPLVTSPYDSGAQPTGAYARCYGSVATLADEHPELVPLLLQHLEPDINDLARKEFVVPALRRLGRPGLAPLVEILEGKDSKEQAVALLCLLDLVGRDYPAREAIPAVMKLVKEPMTDYDGLGYALVLLSRLIAVNEPTPSHAREITPCQGEPIFRGLLRVVRYVRPNGKIGEVVPSDGERGARVSVYPDYLVLEGNNGAEGFTRYIAYKEILELELARWDTGSASQWRN